MTISLTELSDILKRRNKEYGDNQISYGELNTLIRFHDDTAKTNCLHFDRNCWMCNQYNWSFCLNECYTGRCPRHISEEDCAATEAGA